MAPEESRWARRFIGAAIIQGGIAFVITVALLVTNVPGSGLTSASAILAFGQAGTWLTVGYVGYILFPVIGTGLSALFYHYIESVRGQRYEGALNAVAWSHLVLGNLGIGLALGLMMYGGYFGGAAMVPTYLGGAGRDAQFVHTNILGPLALPILVLLSLGALGPFFGGLGYARAWMKKAP